MLKKVKKEFLDPHQSLTGSFGLEYQKNKQTQTTRDAVILLRVGRSRNMFLCFHTRDSWFH